MNDSAAGGQSDDRVECDDRVGRREFLVAGGTLCAATLVAPRIHATDKSGHQNAIVGHGEHTYECIHDWGLANLPRGAHYGNASHGVAVDRAGRVYITHYGDPGSIFVFEPSGEFIQSLGATHRASEDGPTTAQGHGIDIREEGGQEFLYLSPSHPQLDFVKMDLTGEIVWRKGRDHIHTDCGLYGPEAKYRPTNVSFAPDGGYFLGDGYGSDFIHQYAANDQYVRTIGGSGEADGRFRTPHGQWLDQRDGQAKLVVADRANKRLQWFDMQGKFIKSLGGFLFPADIDIRGDVMLVPDLHCRVTLLDKNDDVIVQLGEDAAWRERALEGFRMRGQRDQWLPGKFVHPHDACFDAEGNIFVTEWVDTGRVTWLRKVGA